MINIKKKIILATLVTIGVLLSLISMKILVLAKENIEISHEVCALSGSEKRVLESDCIDAIYGKNIMVEEEKCSFDENVIIEFINCNTCKKITLYDYLIMVVMSEMPYTYENEALKAQAVAARTYTLKMFEDATRHDKNTVCSDPSHCSAGLSKEEYIAKYGEDEYTKAYSIVSQAVKETDGVVITYNDELCTSVYHASSNGATENSYNLWGTYTPYLVSVCTDESGEPQTLSFTYEYFSERVLGQKKDIRNIQVVRNDSGRCEKILVDESEIKASKLRGQLGLKSCDFDVYCDGENIIFTVYGYGHGIGMSQNGANKMAKIGNTYDQILTHYYTGTDIKILA